MKSHQIPFKIACSIGEKDVEVRAVVDQKNNSVHVHLYGDMFGNKRKPIQVKNSGMRLTKGNEAELITHILTDYFSDQQVKVGKIEKLNDQEEPGTQHYPFRIIIRLEN